MKKKKKKLQLKFKYYILFKMTLIFYFFSIFFFSLCNIKFWQEDNKKIKKIEEQITDIVKIEEAIPSEDTILVNEPDDKEDIYWQYKDVAMIDVDLNKLIAKNNDTVGWIQVSGTNINYPIVQSNDNDYYLKRDFSKKKNKGGWIFLDYRNNINELSKNNIIYGHRRYNESMFGTLKKVLTKKWQQNTDNHIIKVSTSKFNYLFQVFSVYQIPNETYYLQTEFLNDKTYLEFLNTVKNRSEFSFNTEVNQDTIILTLSTCHNKEDRLVVHSKLIKVNQK